MATRVNFKLRNIGKTDLRVTELGLGCASIAGINRRVTDQAARTTLEAAVNAGVGYVDTAPFYGYGRSERMVGDALRSSAKNSSEQSQQAPISLSTKVGRLLHPSSEPQAEDDRWIDALPMRPVFDYSYDGIMRSFEDSLQRLGLAHIDMIYLHDVDVFTHGVDAQPGILKSAMSGGYRAMAELRASGRVKAIGVGVNEWEVCLQAMDQGDWDCLLLAGRYTLLEQQALDKLMPACEQSNTSVVIGGPFNSGILVGGDTYDYYSATADVVSRVQAIEAVCSRHGVPLPAAALQFPMAHPVVASVIPGPRTPGEFNEIISWYNSDIPVDVWADLKQEGLLREDAPTPS